MNTVAKACYSHQVWMCMILGLVIKLACPRTIFGLSDKQTKKKQTYTRAQCSPASVLVWGSRRLSSITRLSTLVPRPCAFVAFSTKFTQRAWARSSRDACHSLRHDPSTKINDVIDELPLKEAPPDHSNGSRVNLPKC